MNLDSKYGMNPFALPSKSKSSLDEIFVKSKGGGLGRAARTTQEDRKQYDPEVYDPPVEPEKIEEKPKEPKSILSEGAWIQSETLFHQETEVSVKVALPPGKEHLTRVEAELHVKKPSGSELIARSEGHAKADGTAVFKLPVYKPTGHQGEPVDYYLVFKHKLATLLQPDALLRTVSDIALKAADHVLIPGICFAKDSSFIRPKVVDGLKTLETRVKEWDTKHPGGKIVLFGHANPDEKNPKALSERRAESAYAFITNDAGSWERLYGAEKWGLIALQEILLDLGHYKGKPDNLDGPSTQAAFKAIQKKAGLPESGKEDAATRKAVFSAYMKGKHDIKLAAGRFRKVTGHPWMGCSSHNRAKDGDQPAPENRRVAFLLLTESSFFPISFPCQDGNETACSAQCKKTGKRSKTGIKCLFYDELVREGNQDPQADDSPTAGTILTKEQLKKISGASDALVQKYQPDLNTEMKNKGIDSNLEKAHFLAQLCAESGSLRYSEEIANGAAYEGRTDLGNTQTGDGIKFKGRGLIQVTGRSNYTAFGTYCGEDFTTGQNHTKVGEPKNAVLSAIWYWNSRELNKHANEDNFLQVTFRVNGGFNGIKERAKFLKKGYETFGFTDTKKRLEKIFPPIKTNLDKVLPLVNAAIQADSGLTHATAAKKLHKEKKISLFERLLFVAVDSDAHIQTFKTELGV